MSEYLPKAPDFKLPLSSGGEFHLYSVLNNGPVILTFIIGTWCPTCQSHLAKMRNWTVNKTTQSVTILVVSAQSLEAIRKYLEQNPTSYLFASDEALDVVNLFECKMPMMKMSRPATFLIDTDKTIRMKHLGIRGTKLKNKVESETSKL
jgi:peroxiredoxin